jgi:hypothetical protein
MIAHNMRSSLRMAGDVALVGAGCALAFSALWYCYLWHIDLTMRRQQFRLRLAVKLVDSFVRFVAK